MRNLGLHRAPVVFAAALATTTLGPHGATRAAGLEPETVLYSFCAKGGTTCTDGRQPGPSALVSDAAGRLYGTTQAGGAHAKGTVFELNPNAAKTKWTETVLYSFCAEGGTSCTDGSVPVAGLMIDKAGQLYGTTADGGAHRDGVVFTLSPNAAKSKWTETILYSFGSHGGDGAFPAAGLIADAAGHLYGTTYGGGAHSGGTVYELTPNSAKTKWAETVLHSFSASGSGGTAPYAALIMDTAGNLYGTTSSGVSTAFELVPNAARTKWTEKVLHTFCATNSFPKCADGAEATAGLLMDGTGSLYGTTDSGGANGTGMVFELTANAAKTKWTERVLYSFCTQKGCGSDPFTGVIMDSKGNLYGTAGEGRNLGGIVYELTHNAAKTKWTETTLYDFCGRSAGGQRCADGDAPSAPLIMDARGHLYGTTYGGGAHPGVGEGGGTVYELP